jgi:hypothetical protein
VGTELFHAEGQTVGQTDSKRHDAANSPFSQFFERAWKRKRRHPNSKLSNEKFANLIFWLRRSVGCVGQKIVAKNRDSFSILSAVFECGVLLRGHFDLSEGLYAHSLWNKSEKTRTCTRLVRRISLQTWHSAKAVLLYNGKEIIIIIIIIKVIK